MMLIKYIFFFSLLPTFNKSHAVYTMTCTTAKISILGYISDPAKLIPYFLPSLITYAWRAPEDVPRIDLPLNI
jgi:hypothetical protein